ncbi:MAG TPA: hypothetical protein VGC81_00545 [Candidatus Methylomirabilis sp.]|jgi:hypothetical protein
MPKLAMSLSLLATLSACADQAGAPPLLSLDRLGMTAVTQLDSLPTPVVEVRDGRVVIQAHFGLGATGYALTPHGTIEDGVIDLVVAAEMPAEMAGLQVLTAYAYRLATPVLEPGTWSLRLHHAVADEGDPEFILEQAVVVPR